ncbi:hypothetical protein Val02_80140 [Virgisporangium aliadipatigenens]|uniref:Transposase n=1 Tax=Virgisporangium aliadipatigenens TaxID=741659 RepID=A0A8J3YWU5_9ACTN|nr:transposase [Virgisporangium aliadipatigenens]GIJ51128.1 hypothetical protein Val02_80140 [Virgisporangium aliadipatigenens]
MTLVRVYCGLASAESAVVTTDVQAWLTVAVVDDSGRLVDICEISDDPGGYAELCALFAQRGAGSGGVAIATQGNDHVVTKLLAAAGRYLSLSDESSVDDYAERFADDESPEEMRSGRAERRAVGLARALQAGVLSAVPQAPPGELLSLKPLLAAHDAVVTGRRSAAGTLRDVLRELYPAALRAYADPAEPVPLAVLDALPEPGQLAAGRTQETHIVAQLVEAGVAERATVAEAVTALRVAISETPRRAGMTRAMTSAVAESVRQTVASVRACDAAAESMVEVIADRMAEAAVPGGDELPGPTPLRVVQDDDRQSGGRRRSAASAASLVPPADHPAERGATFGGLRTGEQRTVPAPAAGFASRTGEHRTVPAQPAAGFASRTGEQRTVPAAGFGPRTGEQRTVPAPGFGPRTGEHRTVPAQPAARSAPTVIPSSSRRPQGRPDLDQPAAAAVPAQSPPVEPPSPLEQAVRRATGATGPRSGVEMPGPLPTRGQTAPPSVSAEYPMVGHLPPAGQLPPASAPQSGPRRPPFTRAEPTLYTTGEYSRLAASFDRESGDSTNGGGSAPAPRQSPEATRAAMPPAPIMPVEPPQLSPEVPAPGSRSTWPNTADGTQPEVEPEPVRNGVTDVPRLVDLPRQREGRIVPPWQSDDLPAEPPTLRLVEPAPLADPALSSLPQDSRLDPPALRLVEPDPPPMRATNGSRSAGLDPLGDAPVDLSAADDDLLIFSQCRSAWFTDPTEENDAAEDELDWGTAADLGWQAARQADRPAVGAETGAGLPKRVPQENLVPGSAIPPPERPLRIVRDAASIAAHTSGYFSGYRRGQEVGGFSVGGRPGRESSTGWDFAREASNSQQFTANGGQQEEYEYRSARR